MFPMDMCTYVKYNSINFTPERQNKNLVTQDLTQSPIKRSPLTKGWCLRIKTFCFLTLILWKSWAQAILSQVSEFPQPLNSTYLLEVPSGPRHVLLPAQGGCGLHEQHEQEHGGPQHSQEERFQCQVLRSRIPSQAPRNRTQPPGGLRFLHHL